MAETPPPSTPSLTLTPSSSHSASSSYATATNASSTTINNSNGSPADRGVANKRLRTTFSPVTPTPNRSLSATIRGLSGGVIDLTDSVVGSRPGSVAPNTSVCTSRGERRTVEERLRLAAAKGPVHSFVRPLPRSASSNTTLVDDARFTTGIEIPTSIAHNSTSSNTDPQQPSIIPKTEGTPLSLNTDDDICVTGVHLYTSPVNIGTSVVKDENESPGSSSATRSVVRSVGDAAFSSHASRRRMSPANVRDGGIGSSSVRGRSSSVARRTTSPSLVAHHRRTLESVSERRILESFSVRTPTPAPRIALRAVRRLRDATPYQRLTGAAPLQPGIGRSSGSPLGRSDRVQSAAQDVVMGGADSSGPVDADDGGVANLGISRQGEMQVNSAVVDVSDDESDAIIITGTQSPARRGRNQTLPQQPSLPEDPRETPSRHTDIVLRMRGHTKCCHSFSRQHLNTLTDDTLDKLVSRIVSMIDKALQPVPLPRAHR